MVSCWLKVLYDYNNHQICHYNSIDQMPDNHSEPLASQQLPLCQICHLQPSPESAQYYPFIVLEILLLFYSLKLAAITFLASFCFSKTNWLCPQCKRNVEIGFEIEGSNENIILRMGNCMFMLSKNKFRIIAFTIIAYLIYLLVVDWKSKPDYHLEKTWSSLANNCGYEAHLQNSYKANTLYMQYPKMGEWQIQGVYLRQTKIQDKQIYRIYLKMNPTQFKNKMTEDIVVYQTQHTLTKNEPRQVGNVLRVVGQWQGKEDDGHVFRFVATKISKVDIVLLLDNIRLISNAERFIRLHDQQQKLLNNTASHLTKSSSNDTSQKP